MKSVLRWAAPLLSWRAFHFLAAAIAVRLVPFLSTFTVRDSYGFDKPYFSWIWGNMDGAVFMVIAKEGYGLPQLPFFPLFPILIRYVTRYIHFDYVYAGQFVATLAFLGCCYVFYQLLKTEKKLNLLPMLLLVWLTFPTSFYYTSVYNDSIFLLLASSTLLLARRGHWFWAGAAGALASLARLNGQALFAFLFAEYLVQSYEPLANKWNLENLKHSILKGLDIRSWLKRQWFWALLIPGALLGYLAWIQVAFGDWHLFFKGVEVWHRDHLVFPLQTLWRYAKILATTADWNIVYIVAWGEALFTALYGLVAILSWQKMRFSYWVFLVVSMLIPMSTGTLQGMPRYGLHMFPLFFFLARWLDGKPKWVKVVYGVVMLVLQGLYVAAFTRGYFVA